MRGYSHALSGAVAWTVVATPTTPLVPLSLVHESLPDFSLGLGLVEVDPIAYALGLVLTSGAALLPDIDHHNGTIAHSLPKVGFIPSPTQILCRFIGKISGGHRHGTHSILGIAIFILLAFLLGRVRIPIAGQEYAFGAALLAFLLTAFAFAVFKIGAKKAWLFRWIAAAAVAAAITFYFPDQWALLPIIVGLGAFVHCLGDMLTVGGVPWLYPLTPKTPKALKDTFFERFWQNNGYFAFPILGTTDSGQEKGITREGVLGGLMTVYISACIVIASIHYITASFPA